MMNTTLLRGFDQRRAVLVRVYSGGHEVDSFEAASPETLRSAIRPIYAHLPLSDAVVSFTGVESERQLFRSAQRRERELPSLGTALEFLTGKARRRIAARSNSSKPTRKAAAVR